MAIPTGLAPADLQFTERREFAELTPRLGRGCVADPKHRSVRYLALLGIISWQQVGGDPDGVGPGGVTVYGAARVCGVDPATWPRLCRGPEKLQRKIPSTTRYHIPTASRLRSPGHARGCRQRPLRRGGYVADPKQRSLRYLALLGILSWPQGGCDPDGVGPGEFTVYGAARVCGVDPATWPRLRRACPDSDIGVVQNSCLIRAATKSVLLRLTIHDGRGDCADVPATGGVWRWDRIGDGDRQRKTGGAVRGRSH